MQAPVGLVPTMGGLHEGHLSLVRKAVHENASVMVSVYVNPTQFDNVDDLVNYPRTWEKDKHLLSDLSVNAVFAPDDSVMYPEDFSTSIKAGRLATRWEGEYRLGHFDGVCTVVAKLLQLVQPDVAYFGEKDYQQLMIIQAMVRDLNIPVRIQTGETIRETDGLALSSRNGRLSPDERARAPLLKASLDRVASRIHDEGDIPFILKEERAILEANGFEVDYLAAVNSETLEPLTSLKESMSARLLLAASLGSVRLIDNCAL